VTHSYSVGFQGLHQHCKAKKKKERKKERKKRKEKKRKRGRGGGGRRKKIKERNGKDVADIQGLLFLSHSSREL
jgi:hypothetical protein